MNFESGNLYHIYNQGNNRKVIFFNINNYDYFISKLQRYLLPYADILAWCLMPNHFHLMVLVRQNEKVMFPEEIKKRQKRRTINDSIGIMLRSYTRAINKQENRSGSLFRNTTKAVPVNCLKSLMPTLAIDQNTLQLSSILSEKQYPQICFDYIHLNPVRAGLVKDPIQWKYSSAPDFYGNRKILLTNVDVAKDFVDINLAPQLIETLA